MLHLKTTAVYFIPPLASKGRKKRPRSSCSRHLFSPSHFQNKHMQCTTTYACTQRIRREGLVAVPHLTTLSCNFNPLSNSYNSTDPFHYTWTHKLHLYLFQALLCDVIQLWRLGHSLQNTKKEDKF